MFSYHMHTLYDRFCSSKSDFRFILPSMTSFMRGQKAYPHSEGLLTSYTDPRFFCLS